MGGWFGPSQEEQYWKERREREAFQHNIHMQQQQQHSNMSQQILHGLETKLLPSLYDQLSYLVQVMLFIGLLIGILVAAYLALKKYMEHEKLKHDMEMQRQQLSHEAVLKQSEMEHKTKMQEKELQQELRLKEKELSQKDKLEEKRLEQERYNAERKYRLDVGKMYWDAHKELRQSGDQGDFSRSMTCITQNILMADQRSDNMGNIQQISRMSYEHKQQNRNIRQRRLGSSSQVAEPVLRFKMHADSDSEQESQVESNPSISKEVEHVDEIQSGFRTPSSLGDDYIYLNGGCYGSAACATETPAPVTSHATSSKSNDCWILEFSRNPSELIEAIESNSQVQELREALICFGCELQLSSGCNVLLHPEAYEHWLPVLQNKNLQKRHFVVSSEMKSILESITNDLPRDLKVRIKRTEELC